MQFSKGHIRNPVRVGQLLEFDSVFTCEQPRAVEEYLNGGNREKILNVAAFLLGFKNNASKYEDN